jgi:hypothetical protein
VNCHVKCPIPSTTAGVSMAPYWATAWGRLRAANGSRAVTNPSAIRWGSEACCSRGRGKGKGKTKTKMGREKSATSQSPAISGSTVMLAAPTTVCCAGKVKSWYKPQGLTLNLKSAERVANYLYLCYTDPLELPPKAFDSSHNRSKLFQTKHMGH